LTPAKFWVISPVPNPEAVFLPALYEKRVGALLYKIPKRLTGKLFFAQAKVQ
jgi:hypothetical protein